MAKTTATDILINRLLAQRQSCVEIRPGVGLIVTRPLPSELIDFRDATAYTAAARWVVGWEGMTEADILGAAIGSPVPIEYSKRLADLVLPDHPDWCTRVQDRLISMVIEHRQQQEQAEGN